MQNLKEITVVYTSYFRTEVLCKSIEIALREFPCSDVYVYCDKWKKTKDSALISSHYCALQAKFSACERVFLIAREYNHGMFNAIEAIDRHLVNSPVLFLEDDLILKEGAGQFITEYCDKYWDDPTITALSLFNPLSSRYIFSGPVKMTRTWMWGTMLWPHKANFLNRITPMEIKLIRGDSGIFAKVAMYLGDEGLNLAIYDYHNKSFCALDCRLAFRHALYGFRSVAPPVNLIQNLGFTGDGAHCPDSKDYSLLFEDLHLFPVNMWLGKEAEELSLVQESLVGDLFLHPNDFSENALRRDWGSFVWPSLQNKVSYLFSYPLRHISYLARPTILLEKVFTRMTL